VRSSRRSVKATTGAPSSRRSSRPGATATCGGVLAGAESVSPCAARSLGHARHRLAPEGAARSMRCVAGIFSSAVRSRAVSPIAANGALEMRYARAVATVRRGTPRAAASSTVRPASDYARVRSLWAQLRNVGWLTLTASVPASRPRGCVVPSIATAGVLDCSRSDRCAAPARGSTGDSEIRRRGAREPVRVIKGAKPAEGTDRNLDNAPVATTPWLPNGRGAGVWHRDVPGLLLAFSCLPPPCWRSLRRAALPAR
jgi:hypothetical protein